MKNNLRKIYEKLFLGRLRSPYFIFAILIVFITQFSLSIFIGGVSIYVAVFIRIIFAVLILSLEIRRLHDLKLPGYIAVVIYLFRSLNLTTAMPILILGFAFDIYLMFASGDEFTNKYGERPKLEKKFFASVFNQ